MFKSLKQGYLLAYSAYSQSKIELKTCMRLLHYIGPAKNEIFILFYLFLCHHCVILCNIYFFSLKKTTIKSNLKTSLAFRAGPLFFWTRDQMFLKTSIKRL